MLTLLENTLLWYFHYDVSRYTWIYFMHKIFEVFTKIKEFKVLVEKQTDYKIRVLRSNNGGEYSSREFNEFCKHARIVRQHTTPYTPQQNGVAERMNCTLVERARSMLSSVKLDKCFWVEVVGTDFYLINRSLCKDLIDKTPYEMWLGKKPSVSHLRVFGCEAFVQVPQEKQSKMNPKAQKCIFVGNSENVKG